MTDADILTGSDAVEHMIETWQNVGQGMVSVEAVGPWLIVSRSGGDYTLFTALNADETFMIMDSAATVEDIPEAHQTDGELPEDIQEMVEKAFSAGDGGAYPVRGDGDDSPTFDLAMAIEGDREALKVDLLGDGVRIV